MFERAKLNQEMTFLVWLSIAKLEDSRELSSPNIPNQYKKRNIKYPSEENCDDQLLKKFI
jgi:hypothetical protein